jgi:acetoin utilization deacetylase AcuC-like enzyme
MKGKASAGTKAARFVDPRATTPRNAALFDIRCFDAPKGRGRNMERPSRLLAAIHVLRLLKQHFGNDMSLFSGSDNTGIMQKLLLAHSRKYVDGIRSLSASLVGEPPERLTDADEEETMIGEKSWEAATAAVSVVCEAIDLVQTTDARRVFCAVRPPGHHAGIEGKFQSTTALVFVM